MQLVADDMAPGAARSAVRRAAASLHDAAPGDISSQDLQLGDIELVTSELVTNAVEYGTGETVELGLRLDDGHMEVRVTNSIDTPGDGAVLPGRPWSMPDPNQLRGRGLAVVEVLAHETEVRVRDGSVEVRAVVPV